MGRFKQMGKACYRGLGRLSKPVLRRLRDYFSQPTLSGIHSYCSALGEQVATLQIRIESLVTQGNLAQTRSLQETLQENDRLLLALLKSVQPPPPAPPPPAFAPVPVGENRLLVPHPAVPFMYLDTRDVRRAPRVILGAFETGVHLVLERFLRPGQRVLEVGAGQGFHTLTLAARVSAPSFTEKGPAPRGKVTAFEPDPVAKTVLRDNVTAHDLGAVVELRPGAVRSRADLAFLTEEGLPDLVRIGAAEGVSATLDALGETLAAADRPIFLPFKGDKAVLERLDALELTLWRIEPEGTLIPVEPDHLLDEPPGLVNLLAVRTLS